MMENSKIQWCDSSWNPWQGCIKVSPGCKLCYMYRDKKRYGQDPRNVVRSKPPTFNAPLKWFKPQRVFTCSWSDFFIKEADSWRQDAWDIIRQTPHLTYQILTKRPENILDRLPDDWGDGWPNVWLGISAENQEQLDRRMIPFTAIRAKIKFLSCEPLLGELDLSRWLGLVKNKHLGDWAKYRPDVNWVIIGGESGPNARPMSLDWARKIDYQCQQAAIPVFWKQLGAVQARNLGLKDSKGGDPGEWPFEGRREFPESIPVEPVGELVQASLF